MYSFALVAIVHDRLLHLDDLVLKRGDGLIGLVHLPRDQGKLLLKSLAADPVALIDLGQTTFGLGDLYQVAGTLRDQPQALCLAVLHRGYVVEQAPGLQIRGAVSLYFRYRELLRIGFEGFL